MFRLYRSQPVRHLYNPNAGGRRLHCYRRIGRSDVHGLLLRSHSRLNLPRLFLGYCLQFKPPTKLPIQGLLRRVLLSRFLRRADKRQHAHVSVEGRNAAGNHLCPRYTVTYNIIGHRKYTTTILNKQLAALKSSGVNTEARLEVEL